MNFTASHTPASCIELRRAPRRVLDPKRLTFLGVDGMDVYNISVPFQCEGRTYLAGRVEPRDTEFSVVRLFERTGDEEYTAILPEMTFRNLQDPFVTRVGDEIVLGGVQIIAHPLDEERIISWQTLFFRGRTLPELSLFAVGPACMKDIRLCGLADGRVALFSRPQGKRGGLGRIGFTVIDSLDDLCADTVLDAMVDPSYFLPEEWGGANDVHLLRGGLLGVMGHMAFRDAEGLHYNAMAFVLDPATGEHTQPRIVACRRDVSVSDACKRPNLMDVLFTGGIIRQGDGTARLYTGVSDCEAWCAVIDDPFAPFEA